MLVINYTMNKKCADKQFARGGPEQHLWLADLQPSGADCSPDLFRPIFGTLSADSKDRSCAQYRISSE